MSGLLIFLLVICAIAYVLIPLLKGVKGGKFEEPASRLQKVAIGFILFAFVISPVWDWGKEVLKPNGCVSGHPCVPAVNDNGSSDPVKVPEGSVPCFAPWIWNNLSKVGLTISYQDQKGHGEPFPCSREQVFKGSCTAVYDRFWFKPPKKTDLPNYWFVASGSHQC